MSDNLEEGFRSLAGEVHDVDDAKHQIIVEFPHETLDSYRTDFARECFRSSYERQLPVMLVEHNRADLIGHALSAEVGARSDRLIGQFSDFDMVPRAREYFAHYRDGDLKGFSYFFRNARSMPHPTVRGGRRFTQADMPEFSATVTPAIPGAGMVGLRSEEPTLSIPTITEIVQLQRDGVIDDAGMRSLIAEHHPGFVDHITVHPTTTTEGARADVPSLESLTALNAKGLLDDDGLRSAIAEHYPNLSLAKIKLVEDGKVTDQGALEGVRTAMADVLKRYDVEGLRSLVITIGNDGSVSTDGGGAATDGGTVTDDGESDCNTLVQAIDAALDHASASIGDMDVTTLPDNVQQALALMNAAGVAVDELQDVLGIEDPDDPVENDQRSEADMDEADDTAGTRAIITGKDRNDLEDSDFAYVEPGGMKDGSGKTAPRNKRHFIIKDAEHVRNALARIGQGAAFSAEAKPAVLKAAKKFKIDVDDSGKPTDGKRSVDEMAEDLRERFGVDAA